MDTKDDTFGANEEYESLGEGDPWGHVGGEPDDAANATDTPQEMLTPADDAASGAPVEHRPQEPQNLTCRVCNREIEGVYYDVGGEIACAYCRELIGATMAKGSPGLRFIGASSLGFVTAVFGGVSCFLLVDSFGQAGDVSNFGFGFLAILVAFFVGTAVKIGSRSRGGWLYQGMAMCLTYCAIVATFVPAVHRTMAEEDETSAASPPALSAVQSTPTDPASVYGDEDGIAGIVWEEMAPPERVFYCVFLYVVAFVAPILACLEVGDDWLNVSWLLLSLFAVCVAAYRNQRLVITINGPYDVAAAGEADRVSGLVREEEW